MSTPSLVLPGYPAPPGGVPDLGTPPGGYPDLGTPLGGYLTRVHPPWGVPDPGTPPGGTQTPRGGTWPGYPPGGYLTQVPPQGGYLDPPGGVPDPGTPRGVPGPPLPPRVDRQTKWNYYLPVVLRTRAVIICKMLGLCSINYFLFYIKVHMYLHIWVLFRSIIKQSKTKYTVYFNHYQ